jgi:hypothetical protein
MWLALVLFAHKTALLKRRKYALLKPALVPLSMQWRGARGDDFPLDPQNCRLVNLI